MGQHKHNQTGIDAKNGLLPPKVKKMTAREYKNFVEEEARKELNSSMSEPLKRNREEEMKLILKAKRDLMEFAKAEDLK